MHAFSFPTQYHQFHKIKIIDYQLNRWYSLGYARFEDMQEVAKKIKNFEDWKREMVALAEKAEKEKRLLNAGIYYRAAEFFTLHNDPDKIKLYDTFRELFYKLFDNKLEKFLIPYADGKLSAIRVSASTKKKKGTIVMHGGFDSFIEEFYSIAEYFSHQGFDVIAFEGPGQGATLKKYHLPLTYEWEKPTKAVLDYFKLTDVTLLGISMGGYLCLRAAAFEPRIKRVIASSVVFDYLQMPHPIVSAFARFLFRFRGLMNFLALKKAQMTYQNNWGVNNMLHITQKKTPVEAIEVVSQFNEKNLHSERIKQDVLILTGAEDHFIPLKMHYKQIAALTHARSITDHIFTRKEQAQNHCQVGNIGLALKMMVDWINSKS